MRRRQRQERVDDRRVDHHDGGVDDDHRGDHDDGGDDHHGRADHHRAAARLPAHRPPGARRAGGTAARHRGQDRQPHGARPQAGLNQADIVYEEIVEGITRFFTIFQSTEAAPVGPIRSARSTDVDLLDQLNRPLFVWSGGNRNVVREIGGANAISMAYGQGPGFYRDRRGRNVATEHTLFNEGTGTIYSQVQAGEIAPMPFFSYRPVGTPSTAGQPVAVIDAGMNSVPVHWAWDAGQGLWIRSEYGAPHVDAAGVPVNAANVVVQFVPYRASSADARSPEAVTIGEGDAWIFTDGKLIFGHWSRPDVNKPATFTDAGGQLVLLTPGRTWIELAEAGTTSVTYG